MEFLINPNVSYVLLVLGVMTAALALFAPGTGLLEAGALIVLVLAGYGIANLPVNGWGVIIILIGAAPFSLGLAPYLARKDRVRLLVVATLLFLIGSAFLYRGESWLPAVSPILMAILWPIALGLTWFVAEKGMEASAYRPVFNPDQLVGMTGQASSDIRGRGTVYVNGEEWSAISNTFIPAGSAVCVLRRSGLTLEVDLVKA
jgi:membrane-bound serine protease (ClpP class)